MEEGGIVARIPGQEIEGWGTLCSLSALTNMLLRGTRRRSSGQEDEVVGEE